MLSLAFLEINGVPISLSHYIKNDDKTEKWEAQTREKIVDGNVNVSPFHWITIGIIT